MGEGDWGGWRGVLTDEGLAFFKPSVLTVVASGASIPQGLKVLDFVSLYGGSSLPLAGRYPQQLKALDF